MSHAIKLFLCLILVLMVSLPIVTSAFAQDEAGATIEVTQHEADVWQAKADFWHEWQFQQRVAETIAATWEAKAAFWLAAE